MFFSSCFHISLPFYQIHTAPATGKRKIRRFLSEIFDRRRRIFVLVLEARGDQCYHKKGSNFALASSASVATLSLFAIWQAVQVS